VKKPPLQSGTTNGGENKNLGIWAGRSLLSITGEDCIEGENQQNDPAGKKSRVEQEKERGLRTPWKTGSGNG